MMRKEKDKEIDEALVRQMAELLTETGLTEIEYSAKDWRLRVVRQPAAVTMTAPAAAAPMASTPVAAPVAEVRRADHPGALKSPMVGTVYLAPEPGAAQFVKPGDKVREGQTLMIIEAMKVMNPIPAPRSGTVADISVANGVPVEYGQLLAVVE